MLYTDFTIKSYDENDNKEEKNLWSEEEKLEHKFEFVVHLIDDKTTVEIILDTFDSTMEANHNKRLTFQECMDSIKSITSDVKEGNASNWFTF